MFGGDYEHRDACRGSSRPGVAERMEPTSTYAAWSADWDRWMNVT